MSQNNMNKARVVYYGLFSAVLSFLETDKNYENIKNTIDFLNENPLETHSEKALLEMKNFLEKESFKGLQAESNLVFFSPSTTYIPVSASFYDEARDDGKKKIEMLSYISESTFRRDESVYKEAEDNIGFILTFIHKLLENSLDNNEKSENSEELAKKVFANILNETIDPFLTNLYNHENADFYKNLALLLKIFMEFERHYYSLTTPVEKEIKETIRPNTKVKKKDAVKRAKRNLSEVTSL